MRGPADASRFAAGEVFAHLVLRGLWILPAAAAIALLVAVASVQVASFHDDPARRALLVSLTALRHFIEAIVTVYAACFAYAAVRYLLRRHRRGAPARPSERRPPVAVVYLCELRRCRPLLSSRPPRSPA